MQGFRVANTNILVSKNHCAPNRTPNASKWNIVGSARIGTHVGYVNFMMVCKFCSHWLPMRACFLVEYWVETDGDVNIHSRYRPMLKERVKKSPFP